MSLRLRGFVAALMMAAVAAIASHRPVTGQSAGTMLTVAPATATELRQWDDRIDRMLAGRELRVTQVQEDTLRPGRRHERLEQFHRNVRVHGAGVSRQLEGAATISVFGAIYDGIDVDPTPRLSIEDARGAIAREGGADAGAAMTPELVVWPKREGGFGLAYVGHAMSGFEMMTFVIDAQTGTLIDRQSDFQHQVIGQGTGVHNDTKKVSARPGTGLFLADDQLRPARITSYDAKSNLTRLIAFLNNQIRPADGDIAADTDNQWTDGATVDAHTGAGWYYDYLFKRFGRRGVDDNNLRIAIFLHPVLLDDIRSQTGNVVGTYYLNAFYCATCGPDNRGAIVFGEGAPTGFVGAGITAHNFASALDVVAHELTHAVTSFTSRLPGVGEGGSLNESFSDVLGLSTEFFYQPTGSGRLRADYVMGEDLSTPLGAFAIRSIDNPSASGNPDHWSRRNPARGIHFDSTIMTHAFYLAIEGGTNRTSGLSVRGVGAANREQMERVFYRAFAQLLPPGAASFALARVTTIQAARDLYGPGSAAERAVTEAWDAVGVQERTAPTLAFTPDPAPGSRTPCVPNNPTPNWIFTSILSAARSGLTVNGLTLTFRDAARTVIETQNLPPAQFANLFRSCGPGSTRVPPQSDACTTVCVNLGGRTSGSIAFAFDLTADDGVRIPMSRELSLLAPPGGVVEESQPFGQPQLMLAR